MINDNVKQTIASTYKSIASNVPSFNERPQQKKLITAIANICSNEQKYALVAEAPTGVGKSLSILLGAIPVALQNKKRVVISTATTALQDQLITKDIPAFPSSLPIEFKFTALKGRSRYICNKRLANASEDSTDKELLNDDPQDAAVWTFKPTQEDLQLLSVLEDKLIDASWDGDRDNLDIPLEQKVWSIVSTDSDGCNGRKCEFYNDCPFYKKKKLVDESDVIIVNHDLLLSDIALGSGIILPDYANIYFMIDEAHHFPDKAIQNTVESFNLKFMTNRINNAVGAIKDVQTCIQTYAYNIEPMVLMSKEITQELSNLFRFIESTKKLSDPFVSNWIFENSTFPKQAEAIPLKLLTLSNALMEKLTDYTEGVINHIQENQIDTDQTDKLIESLNRYIALIFKVNKVFNKLMLDQQDPPLSKWVEYNDKKTDISISVSEVDVSEILHRTFYELADKVVMLSATISTLGNFTSFIEKSGLDKHQNLSTLLLDSPFDFTKSNIVLPKIKSDSNDTDNHAKEVANIINHEPLDEPTGTLCIVTSKKKLNAIVSHLSPDVLAHCIIQTTSGLSKNAIVNLHKKNIDNGKHSIILGLISYAEGVDLPHEYCTHVILDKLPFSSIQEPQLVTLVAYLEKLGRNPFFEISLPDAIIKLKQIIGRLIRNESDQGKVTICDNRVHSKSYAKNMIKSLPPFTITTPTL